MRALILTVFCLALTATIQCFPESRNDREELTTKAADRPQIVIVPLEANIHKKGDSPDEFGDQPIVDINAGAANGFGFNPFFNPFSGLFSHLEAMMARMRQQMSEVLSRLPDKPDSDGLPSSSSEEDGAHGIISLWPRFNIPEGKGNTTSVTKIVDGHKVIVNETTYSSSNDNGGSFFKVRIVDIKPNEDPNNPTEKDAESITGKPSTSAPARDTESIEDSIENEISKGSSNEEVNDIETFEAEIANAKGKKRENVILKDTDRESLENFDAVEKLDNSVEDGPEQVILPGHDLSSDIKVNQLMADAGVPPNSDVEIFDPLELSAFEKNQEAVEMLRKK